MKATTNINGYKVVAYNRNRQRFALVYDKKGMVHFSAPNLLCAMQYAKEAPPCLN